jgi:pimeloyl-ACP methyl ester carboxylesterase
MHRAPAPPSVLPSHLSLMATPTPKSTSRHPARPPSSVPEVVDPRWLLKAFALAVGGAAVLGYLSVCLLLLQGGWQRLIFPSTSVDHTPTSFSIPFDDIHFDAGTTGRPRLTAWWIPTESPSAPTILFLHDVHGSLSATLPTLQLLHQAGVNIFAIDYRGFGLSDPPHPTEARMFEDTNAALDYLVNTRHIPAQTIVPYGQGLGTVMAARLSNQHPELPALIIDSPDPNAFSRVVDESRARLLPMRLLIRERFDIESALKSSNRPKLLLTDTSFVDEPSHRTREESLYKTLPDPKITVTIGGAGAKDVYVETLRRFLDQYVGTRH